MLQPAFGARKIVTGKYMENRFLQAFGTLLLAGAMVACSQPEYVPREGDLLFQVSGTTDFSEAIALTTGDGASLQFVHVAIVALDGNEPYVVEADSRRGVTRTDWDDFLASSPVVNGKPGVVVKRLKGKFRPGEAVDNAESHIGEGYDWHYLPDNGKMYCSELVYESYLTENGEHIFTAKPMNFRNSDGVIPDFWVELFEKLGERVPEGRPGTNPNDMAAEKVLEEVFRFF